MQKLNWLVSELLFIVKKDFFIFQGSLCVRLLYVSSSFLKFHLKNSISIKCLRNMSIIYVSIQLEWYFSELNGSTKQRYNQNKAEAEYFLISGFCALRLNVAFPVSAKNIDKHEGINGLAGNATETNGMVTKQSKKRKISFSMSLMSLLWNPEYKSGTLMPKQHRLTQGS